MAVGSALLTADEYAVSPDRGEHSELVRGEIVNMNLPYPRHGMICSNVSFVLRTYLLTNDLGRIVGNDGGVITARNPDTVRGPDVAFYSYDRVPKGKVPWKYLDVAPELVFEVRSPSDRWSKLLEKVTEYLKIGVQTVCVLDESRETCTMYTVDQPEVTLGATDQLVIANLLPGFAVQVAKFFE